VFDGIDSGRSSRHVWIEISNGRRAPASERAKADVGSLDAAAAAAGEAMVTDVAVVRGGGRRSQSRPDALPIGAAANGHASCRRIYDFTATDGDFYCR